MIDYLRVQSMQNIIDHTTYSPAVENTTAQTGNLSGIVFSVGQHSPEGKTMSVFDLSPILSRYPDSAKLSPTPPALAAVPTEARS